LDLIKGCIKGIEKAHKEFYELYAPYVYAVIKNYVKDKEQRKDALQESFAHIFLSLKEIAKLQNIKEETSRSQLMRAKKWIRNNLDSRIIYLFNEKIQYVKK